MRTARQIVRASRSGEADRSFSSCLASVQLQDPRLRRAGAPREVEFGGAAAQQYTVLHEFAFTSERKLMGVRARPGHQKHPQYS